MASSTFAPRPPDSKSGPDSRIDELNEPARNRGRLVGRQMPGPKFKSLPVLGFRGYQSQCLADAIRRGLPQSGSPSPPSPRIPQSPVLFPSLLFGSASIHRGRWWRPGKKDLRYRNPYSSARQGDSEFAPPSRCRVPDRPSACSQSRRMENHTPTASLTCPECCRK